jgi:topoisomerase-4 subunit A
MQTFALDAVQADAILDLKLRHLARLEEMELRREQDGLTAEQARIQEQLQNPDALKKLIIDELNADAKKYGDDRRSPLTVRAAAVELKESDLMPAEAITVVLSQAGWVRAAKGADVDASALNYRAGDGYLSHVSGKSNQRVYVLDSTGRSYGLAAAALPSARSLGEPLTSKLAPPAGSRFVEVLMGDDTQALLLAGDNGYGFIGSVGALDSNAKAGKAVVSLGDGAALLPTLAIAADAERIAVLSSSGRLLVFKRSELPVMGKGKGNKLMQLELGEVITAMAALRPNDALVLIAGNRPLTLKEADIAHYSGKRGLRGHLLPRGYQKANQMQAG